jgi:hypothetical protein
LGPAEVPGQQGGGIGDGLLVRVQVALTSDSTSIASVRCASNVLVG